MKILLNQNLRDYNTIRIGGKVRWMFFPVNASEIIEAIKFCCQNKVPFFVLAGGSNTVFDDVGMNSRQAVINLSEMNCFESKPTNNKAEVGNSPLEGWQARPDGVVEGDARYKKEIKAKFSNTTPSATLPPLRRGEFAASVCKNKQKVLDQFLYIQTDPGTPLQQIVDLSLGNNAGGMVGLNRVPGTIGGAVVGNAGAYGCEIMTFVETVEYIDLGEIIKQPDWVNVHELENLDCKFGYRDSVFKLHKNWLITKIHLKIPIDSDLQLAKAKYNEIAVKRDAIYPKGFASPGSLFKNILFDTLPPDTQAKIPKEWVMYGNKLPVGKLLESLGLQGFTHGQIQMRPTHANIMTNLGGATYKDAKQTVQILQSKVKEGFGIDIEPEVRFIDGDFGQFWR
jgi:UDP-N-acetylmuramate dehydrogenase